MQRIRVDLPEPDGPQTTMRSPRLTVRSMLRSTWNEPNHLCTPSISIAASGAVIALAPLIDVYVGHKPRSR